jgi:hypothetical protein
LETQLKQNRFFDEKIPSSHSFVLFFVFCSVLSKAVVDVIRTCLGPRAMLKMVLDAMGGIVLTNDGNAILREIDVQHPAAKSKSVK